MRALLVQQQADCARLAQSTAGARVYSAPAASTCLTCGRPLHVQKTRRRHGVTLAHGSFEVVETVLVCPEGCAGPSGQAMSHRAAEIVRLFPKGAVVGYDVLVFVGLQRFLHHRQREEIRTALAEESGIVLSTGEISTLAVRFLDYLQALHTTRAPALRAALQADGGWPLHIDATCENGRGTLLIAYAGWRGWALGAWKIPTERADAILPRLRTLPARFGAPVAVVRDLGRAMAEAAQTFVAELPAPIPILACHQHFARDVGTDLLAPLHDRLRNLFRAADVRPALRSLARDMGRQLGPEIAAVRADLRRALEAEDGAAPTLPEGSAGLAWVRALTQWVLDFAADGTDAGFPYDQPYLDLYRRCRLAGRAAAAWLRAAPAGEATTKALKRLQRMLAPLDAEIPFAATADRLERRARLFGELREVLRLGARPAGSEDAAGRTPEKTDPVDVDAGLRRFTASLQARRPARGPAQDQREAIDLVLDHLDRHGPYLFGHAIALPDGTTRRVDRTNNALEGFHRGLKQGERRRSGRKVLSADFEALPAAAALAQNLACADYVTILCGTLDRLPDAFADLDAAGTGPAALRRQAGAAPEFADLEAASLPTADRQLIRTDAFSAHIREMARQRPTSPHSPRSATAL